MAGTIHAPSVASHKSKRGWRCTDGVCWHKYQDELLIRDRASYSLWFVAWECSMDHNYCASCCRVERMLAVQGGLLQFACWLSPTGCSNCYGPVWLDPYACHWRQSHHPFHCTRSTCQFPLMDQVAEILGCRWHDKHVILFSIRMSFVDLPSSSFFSDVTVPWIELELPSMITYKLQCRESSIEKQTWHTFQRALVVRHRRHQRNIDKVVVINTIPVFIIVRGVRCGCRRWGSWWTYVNRTWTTKDRKRSENWAT